MPTEGEDRSSQTITLQFGRASNHVGAHYWNILDKGDDKKVKQALYRTNTATPRVYICDFNRSLGPVSSCRVDPRIEANNIGRLYADDYSEKVPGSGNVKIYQRDGMGDGMHWSEYMGTPLERCYKHFVSGNYGVKEDAYYYSSTTDWSETAIRKLIEGCDSLETVQMLYDVSTSFAGECVAAFEWLAEEVPKKDVILLPLETFGKGVEGEYWSLNFAYSICHCVSSESSPLHVLGCLPTGAQPLGSILDNAGLYKRSAPLALSLAALTYSGGFEKNRAFGKLTDWGILGGCGKGWKYTANKVPIPEHFPRGYVGLEDDAETVSVETSLESWGPNSRKEVTRCLSDLRKLKAGGGLNRCIANSNGVLEADNVDEFETTLRGMIDVDVAVTEESDD